ncbi:hypothetical protein BH11PSE8_BH11PSE8_32490 [soil metagenome]
MRQENNTQVVSRHSEFRAVSMAAVAAVATAIAAMLLFSYVNLLNEAVERGVRLRYAQQSGDITVPSPRGSTHGLALENSLTSWSSASRQRSTSVARADH